MDFFDKPFVLQDLLDGIQDALARSRETEAPSELRIRLELLSRTQRDVLALLVQGSSEEETSALSLHKKSVQRHRKKALEKLKIQHGQEHLLQGFLPIAVVHGA